MSLLSPSGDLRLDPYTPAHVPTYHGWMSSPALLEATGSEPLSLAEELASCAAWRDDPEKLTFILVDVGASPPRMVGDVNVILGIGGEEDGVAEVDVMVAVEGVRRRGVAGAAVRAAMAWVVVRTGRGVGAFVAKVKSGNEASLRLFGKLGFVEVRRVPAFDEVHLRWEVGGEERGLLENVLDGWRVLDYAAVEACIT